ncbi:MAG: palindromic element RPE1 domain-containing protein [Candidatus Tisiphia sp.]
MWCEGDAESRPAAYSNVREDSSTDVAYKSPAEVEFRKRSNEPESHQVQITTIIRTG